MVDAFDFMKKQHEEPNWLIYSGFHNSQYNNKHKGPKRTITPIVRHSKSTFRYQVG
jgi:hypothetical protein